MIAQYLLIKKYRVQTHFRWTTTLSWRKKNNNNIYIVEQLGALHSYIWIVAFLLGTIKEPREWRDIAAEPEDGEWWIRLEDGRMDPDTQDRRKRLTEQLFSN